MQQKHYWHSIETHPTHNKEFLLKDTQGIGYNVRLSPCGNFLNYKEDGEICCISKRIAIKNKFQWAKIRWI